MEYTQLTLFGKMCPARSAPTADTIFKWCLRKSQKPIFQYLQADGGQTTEWFEGAELLPHGECLTPNNVELNIIGLM